MCLYSSLTLSNAFVYLHFILCYSWLNFAYNNLFLANIPGDLTVSKKPGTSYQIEIHVVVFNHLYELYLLFSFVKLVETL